MAPGVPWHIRIRRKFQSFQKSRRKGGSKSPTVINSAISTASVDSGQRNSSAKSSKLRVDMIRRLADDQPRLINPMGWISESREQNTAGGSHEAGRVDTDDKEDENDKANDGLDPAQTPQEAVQDENQ